MCEKRMVDHHQREQNPRGAKRGRYNDSDTSSGDVFSAIFAPAAHAVTNVFGLANQAEVGGVRQLVEDYSTAQANNLEAVSDYARQAHQLALAANTAVEDVRKALDEKDIDNMNTNVLASLDNLQKENVLHSERINALYSNLYYISPADGTMHATLQDLYTLAQQHENRLNACNECKEHLEALRAQVQQGEIATQSHGHTILELQHQLGREIENHKKELNKADEIIDKLEKEVSAGRSLYIESSEAFQNQLKSMNSE